MEEKGIKGIKVFTAEQAKKLRNERLDLRNGFIDYNKMSQIFHDIEEYIIQIPADKSERIDYYPAQFIYPDHLSLGEVSYLESHGYKIKHVADDGNYESHHKITW